MLAPALGVAQLIAWGSIYYAIAVLGEAMQRELQIEPGTLYGAFAWSLALSGLLAPWAGRALDRRGARPVMISSLVVGALGFVTLSQAHATWSLAIAWTVLGVAMALGLYETCFAALAQASPHNYRASVTTVTLIAGFASSVFWPVSHYLAAWLGWRGACLVFAVLLLACVPLYAYVLPTQHAPPRPASTGHRADIPRPMRHRARWLAWAFAGTALVSAALSAHLVKTLADLQFAPTQAVWIASSVGVLQVFGRVLQVRAARVPAHRLGIITFVTFALSLVALLGTSQLPWAVVVFVLCYGVANGVMTIVKAVIPIELFGTHEAGLVLGRFSAPSLIARALGPWAYAAQQARWGSEGALWLSIAVAWVSTLAFVQGSRTASDARSIVDTR